MGVDLGRLKKQATILASLLCVLAFALGVLAFALALRPCRLALTPGMVVDYSLTTTISELASDGTPGTPRSEVRKVHLVGTGTDNEMALISPASDGDPHHDQLCLLDFSADGAAFRLDAAARPLDMGVAIGFFDFNLMPLPEGSEQPRDVSVNYAVLPIERNPVQGRVRRTKSGAKPIFQLKLQSSVEWLGTEKRYHQVRDLVSVYRFNTALGVVDHAKIDLLAGVERDDGAHRFQISMTLDLDGGIGHTRQDPQQLREQVLASAQAQELLHSDDHDRSQAVAEKLRAADISLPELRQAADRIVQAILKPGASADGHESQWWLRVVRGPPQEQAQAEGLRRRLTAAGFASQLRVGDDALDVLAGPYPNPDPVVLAALARHFPEFSPTWEEMP